MNDETFNSRDEAIDFGEDYEYLMAAYYSLIFSLDDQIKDFEISTNNNDFGDFDDVVIELTLQNAEKHIFAIQLKHFVRVIAQITLISNKKFNLQKYNKTFQEVKKNYMKNPAYKAPFENIHFILFSNSTLEKNDEISEDWSKLEPVVNNTKVETDFLIRQTQDCFSKKFLDVSQNQQSLLYEFKTQNDNAPENEFLKQFSFFTAQKSATEMESFIAQLILERFKSFDQNVVINYLNFFNYWCRRDYGVVKLTRENVRLKLAELILSPHIPEPEMKRLNCLKNEKVELLLALFLLFDLVHIKNISKEVINKIWDVVLRHYIVLDKKWSEPLPGIYIDFFFEKLTLPLSAYSENFNAMSLKKLYILTWHTVDIPLVVKIDKMSTQYEDILLAIKLTENGDKKKKIILIDENSRFSNHSSLRVLRNMLDFFKQFPKEYDAFINTSLISIQGRKRIPLSQFLSYDERLMEIVTIEDFILMMDDNFLVGKNCKKYFPKYYMNRLIPKLLLDIKVITELKDDIFILDITNYKHDNITPINSFDINKYLILKKFGSSKDYSPKQLQPSGTDENDISQKFFITTTTGCTKNQFEEICSINPETNCHYIRLLDDKKVEWIQSSQTVDQIEEYRLDLQLFQTEDFIKDENVLAHFNNPLNIICAEPGMGKTVMMKTLMQHCTSDHWVILIHLCDHVKFFKQEHTFDEILNYFLSKENDSLLTQNIVNIFSSTSKILFLWDGFDEIPEICSSFVIKAIQLLANHQFPQWIAGRMDSKKILETSFNTFALRLVELDKQNQYDYVYFYLKEKYQDDEKVEKIIDRVNENITTSLNCGYFDYTGIPLQIHMIVDIYLRKTNLDNESLTIITLTDIYQKFIEGKFDILFERAEADFDNDFMQEIREEYREVKLNFYENAAVKATFDSEILQNINIDCDDLLNELQQDTDSLGLIVGINDLQKPVFAHKTYQEFLVSSWLAKNYQLYPSLIKILFEEKFANIRMMFDMLLARDSPIHLAVLYHNLDLLKLHKENIKFSKDKAGRNPLHIACSWGRNHPLIKVFKKEQKLIPVQKSTEEKREIYLSTLDFLNNCNPKILQMMDTFSTPDSFIVADKTISSFYEQTDTSVDLPDAILINHETVPKVVPDDEIFFEILKFLLNHGCDIFQKDSLLKWNVIQYADYTYSLGAINLLLSYEKFEIESLTNFNDTITIIHYAVVLLYNNLFSIIPNIPYIEYKYHFGSVNCLQLACEINNVAAVEELLKIECYKKVLNNQSAFGGNLLATVALHGNIEIMDTFINAGIQINGHKSSPLASAALGNKIDCCKKLLIAGADINATARDGITALIISIMLNQNEMTKFLLENGADVNQQYLNNTPFYFAIGRNDMEIVELLFKHGSDINLKNGDLEYTPLHFVSELGDYELVKWLLQHGADTKIKSKKLLLPLHVALFNKKQEIAVELIKADPSVINDGYTSDEDPTTYPIIIATVKECFDVMDTLIQYGADVNVTSESATALHCAALRGLDACASILIKGGADVNKPGDNLLTPLFLAVHSLETTQILLKNSADINARSSFGATVMHFAAFNGTVGVIQELVKYGADINAKDKDNYTPLHRAILNKRLEITEFLLNQEILFEDDIEILCMAVRADFPDCIPLLIKKGSNVNGIDKHGMTPLLYAGFYNDSCVKVLLENGADPNFAGSLGIPPLLHSLFLSNTDSLQNLIKFGALCQNTQASSALHIAALTGDIFSLLILLGNGADVTVADHSGCTALHYVCGGSIPKSYLKQILDNEYYLGSNYNKEDCLKEIIAKGGNINQQDNAGLTPLHLACKENNFNIAKILLQNGANPNILDNESKTPLHMCFTDETKNVIDYKNIIELLVNNDADINLKDNEAQTVLFYACLSGDLDLIKFLHQKGGDLFVTNKNEETLLFFAYEQTPVIEYLVESGLDVNFKSLNFCTPLYKACIYNNYTGVVYLVNKGADVNSTTKEKFIPITGATTKGHFEIVKLLLSLGSDITHKNDQGYTSIVYAAAYGYVKIVQLFIENFKNDESIQNEIKFEWILGFTSSASNGHIEIVKLLLDEKLVSINDHDDYLVTALHTACNRGQYEVITYLLENGANVNVKTIDGCTPSYFASCNNYLDIMKLLNEYNADVDVANNHGNTPLFSASAYGHLEMVTLLHELGARINVIDDDGDIPLHDAAVKGYVSIVEYLVRHGADTKHKNKNDKTPLDLAIDAGHQDIIDFLKTK